jgi:NADH dehydrogenase
MKVFVTGGSGHVGDSVLRLLSEAGHESRVLSRDPEPVRARLTAIRGVYPVRGDITENSIDQLASLMAKNKAIIHLVGVIIEKGTPGFEAIHVEGTRRIVEAAKQAGISRFIHMSALGARDSAPARYHQTKFAAEQIVRESGLDWTIFRPSIIYGERDEFLNTFAGIARLSPALPILGSGKGKLQPIWVEDVARCFAKALELPETIGQTYEMGGDQAWSIKEIMRLLVSAMGKRRMFLHIPLGIARLQAKMFNLLPGKPPFNEDQITMLGEDNVCDAGPLKKTFGVTLRPMEDYLQARFGKAKPAPDRAVPAA